MNEISKALFLTKGVFFIALNLVLIFHVLIQQLKRVRFLFDVNV